MKQRLGLWGALSAAIIALPSCGEGGGKPGVLTINATPTSTPAPTATPTPTPTTTPAPAPLAGGAINERVGLKQLTDFPTLSWLYRPTMAGDADGVNLISFGYDSSRRLSIVTVPGYATGGLIEFPTETTDDLSFSLVDPSFGSARFFDRGIAAELLVPGAQNRILALDYTSVGWVGWQGINTAAQDKLAGVLVYGVPTAAGDRPTSGTDIYKLYGFAVTRAAGALGQAQISTAMTGTAQVDQAIGAFTGAFGANGGYVFGPAAIAADASFAGSLTGGGRFEGRFTGPGARELMIRWQARSVDPATGRTETMFGVLAGRKG